MTLLVLTPTAIAADKRLLFVKDNTIARTNSRKVLSSPNFVVGLTGLGNHFSTCRALLKESDETAYFMERYKAVFTKGEIGEPPNKYYGTGFLFDRNTRQAYAVDPETYTWEKIDMPKPGYIYTSGSGAACLPTNFPVEYGLQAIFNFVSLQTISVSSAFYAISLLPRSKTQG